MKKIFRKLYLNSLIKFCLKSTALPFNNSIDTGFAIENGLTRVLISNVNGINLILVTLDKLNYETVYSDVPYIYIDGLWRNILENYVIDILPEKHIFRKFLGGVA